MSDGPWRSLPMRPHWKQVAKQAERQAFSKNDIREVIAVALRKEAADIPLDSIRRAVVPNGQRVLIGPKLSGELDAIRRAHSGSKTTQALLDILNDRGINGSPRKELLQRALSDSLEECVEDHSRAIAEHYFRNCAVPKVDVEGRIETAIQDLNIQCLALQILESPESQKSANVVRRAGLDDGPEL